MTYNMLMATLNPTDSLTHSLTIYCRRLLWLQKGETEGFHKELEELHRRNASLVKEVERLTMQAEKPLEQQQMSVSFCVGEFRVVTD